MKKAGKVFRKLWMFVSIICVVITVLLCIKQQKDFQAYQVKLQDKEKGLNLQKEEYENLLSTVEGLNKEIYCLEQENQTLAEEIKVLKCSSGNGIKTNGQLSVHNGKLVSEHNMNIILRGVSSHGLSWYPKYTNASAMATLKDYGANLFRIAMYSDQNGGYVYETEKNKIYMYMAIENVLSQDMYVIIDWHVLRDENPLKYMEEAKVFFEEISQHYANNNGIIYEICNEPNGSTTWSDICQYAEQVIPIIRTNSPNAIILIGTPNFCSDLEGPINNPLPYENILYSYHQYIDVSKEDTYGGGELKKAIDANLPVFVSEWGISYGDKEDSQILSYQDNSLYFGQANEFIDFLEAHDISWCGWSLSNKAEAHSMILNKCDKLSGWTKEDMTPSGWFMVQKLMYYKEN